MSNQPSKIQRTQDDLNAFENSESQRVGLGLSPRSVWIGMVILAAIVVVVAIQLLGELPWQFLLVLIVLFGLSVRYRLGWGIFCCVCLLVAARLAPRYDQEILELDFVLILMVMLFAGLSFRFVELAKYLQGYWGASEQAIYQSTRRYPHFPATIRGRWWLIPVAIGLALVLLSAFPYDPTTGRRLGIKPFAARPIFFGFFLFFIWFTLRTVFGLATSWRITPAQADIRARSLAAKEFWKDHAAIESRRAKIRARRID